MTFIPWTEQEVSLLVEHTQQGKNDREISENITMMAAEGCTGFPTARSIKAVERKRQKLSLDIGTDRFLSVDSRWLALSNIQRIYKEQSTFLSIGLTKTDKYRKILSLSDIHFPFAKLDYLNQAISDHADADILVLNGDIGDGYVFSTFDKDKSVAAIDEYRAVFNFVCLVKKKFKKVVLIEGNHDARFRKALARSEFSPDAFNLFGVSPLDRIANGENIDRNGKLISKIEMDNVYFPSVEPWWIQIGKTLFIHPHSRGSSKPAHTVSGWAKKFQDRLPPGSFDSVVAGHCFDEETEILTQRGWMDIDNIQLSDKVGTLNLNSNSIEWNSIKAFPVYNNHNQLLKFKDRTGFEAVVTPEHGMLSSTYYRREKGHQWEKSSAETLKNKKKFLIPTAAIDSITNDHTISDDQLKLLAWIVSEGCYEGLRTDGWFVNIRLSQSDDHNGFVNEIDNLLDRLDISYTKSLRYSADSTNHNQHRNYNAYRWVLHSEKIQWVKEFLTKDKVFNQTLINSLSQRQRLLLLTELCKGDGSKLGENRYRVYYTNNETLRDQVQTILVLSGKTSRWQRREDGTYYINFSDRDQRCIKSVESESYSGRTFCLTVENGTLIARRRGFTFITQNTHQQSKHIQSNLLLIEQGCLCDYMSYSWSPRELYHSSAINGYAVIYQDEEGNTDFNKSHTVYLGQLLPAAKPIFGGENARGTKPQNPNILLA